MKKFISGRNVSGIGKLCALLVALFILCSGAPLHAALIESNGTGVYEVTGNDIWGVQPPHIDGEVSSITINEGASLTLRWGGTSPYTVGMIYGNGNMTVSGGGTLIGAWESDDPSNNIGSCGIYGVNSICDITLSSALGDIIYWGFSSFPYDVDGWNYKTISFDRKNLTVQNVRRQSSQNNTTISFALGAFNNKEVSINGGISMALESSDFTVAYLLQAFNSSVNINGGSTMSVTGSTIVQDSFNVDTSGVGGSVWTGQVSVVDSPYQESQANRDAYYKLQGESRILIKDVTVASKTTDGYLGIFAGTSVVGASDKWKATAEIESSYAEISNVKFEGTGEHSLYVSGGGQAVAITGDNDGNLRQYLGGAENRITGASEIVISGDEVYSSLATGNVYCGGSVIGDNAISTVGSAKLTLKDMNVWNVKWDTGIISGQGNRQEYPDNTVDNMVTYDYTDSVLGDSVLVLDNVKADMSSDTDKVTVKYFDEIQLANNTAVKLTTLDGDVKKLTVTGAWGAEVTALEFKQPVQNFAAIAVDHSAASGVTVAYFTDDGMKFIVNGTGGATPEEPSDPEQPSTGGSGGGSGGCNAGFGSLAFLAMAAFVPIAGMKFRKK